MYDDEICWRARGASCPNNGVVNVNICCGALVLINVLFLELLAGRAMLMPSLMASQGPAMVARLRPDELATLLFPHEESLVRFQDIWAPVRGSARICASQKKSRRLLIRTCGS